MVASKSMGAYGHPLSLTKHAFFVLFMYRGHADVWGHVDTSFVWQSILSLCCVCTGGIQTSSKYIGASKHLSFSSQTRSHFPRLVPTICTKKPSLIHSDSTWWSQPSWILPSWIQTLPSWIQTPCYLLSDSLKNTLPPTSSKYMGASKHLSFSSQTHSHFPRLVPTICTKKPSLIHSDSTWWWQPSWILPCWIQTLPSWIQTPCYLLSDSLKNTLPPLWLWLKLIQSDSNSFILTQLDDGSHLEFCHVGFRHLVFFSQIHSKTLSLHSDSDSN